jgi:hypothetical protein
MLFFYGGSFTCKFGAQLSTRILRAP